MNIVSLTLRDCLGLSFQGMYIYLFIYLFIYYYYYYLHSIWSHFNSRGGNSEGGARDTCPYIDTSYSPENSLKII